jgi:hypothetical protein
MHLSIVKAHYFVFKLLEVSRVLILLCRILTLHMNMFKETRFCNSLTIHELDNKMINESLLSIGIFLHPTENIILFHCNISTANSEESILTPMQMFSLVMF